jgi:acetolactate synthase-1/2/3 large subunit
MPIHPARVARELRETIDPDVTIVIDSFTMSGWISQYFHARFPGQILDAGPLAPVGHGVSMAIGAQLAHRESRSCSSSATAVTRPRIGVPALFWALVAARLGPIFG